MVLATVQGRDRPDARRPARRMVIVDVTDGSGYLRVTFFNQPWRERQLPRAPRRCCSARSTLPGRRQMTNPVVDLVGDKTGRIVPVYPQSEKAGITTWDVDRMDGRGAASGPASSPTRCPTRCWPRCGPDRPHHAPSTTSTSPSRWPTPSEARRAAGVRRAAAGAARAGAAQARAGAPTPRASATTLGGRARCVALPRAAAVPAHRRAARAIGEIERDLAGPHPMHRLLQGDVGAGKTVVAVSALLVAVQGGHQGALWRRPRCWPSSTPRRPGLLDGLHGARRPTPTACSAERA